MSGTSLDGLDMAHVQFEKREKGITFKMLHFETIAYDAYFRNELKNAISLSTEKIFLLDKKIGKVFAENVLEFLKKHNIEKHRINVIASHGQTIFHQPSAGFTSQIGCGSTIAFLTDIPVVNDFRTLDVIAGGQGAPLVPIGDKLLFGNEVASFLNIGGFCNISFTKNEQQVAFDICPGNLPLNRMANSFGLDYDKNGELAKSGKINASLLTSLNELPFYAADFPKSLGTEWLEESFMPLLHSSNCKKEDLLRTITEHISFQISKTLNENNLQSLYITGGGAKNDFLIYCLRKYYAGQLIIPSEQLIDCKEALIFALLGAMYLWDLPSNVPSVSGASEALILGTYHKTGRIASK